MAILGGNNQSSRSNGILGRSQREEYESGRQQREYLRQNYPEISSPTKSIIDFGKRLEAMPSTSQLKSDWVEDRLAMDRKNTEKSPILRTVNNFLEPVSKKVYEATANIPGVASFQTGAANALSIPNYAPPVTGSDWINKPAELLGNVAGAAAGIQGSGIRPLADPLAIGRSTTQLASPLIPKLATSPIGQAAVTGSVAGGVAGAVDSAIRGDTDLKDIALGGAIGAATGGLLDGGSAVLTQVAKGAAQSILGRNVAASQAIESAAQSKPTSRLKVQSNTDRLNSILEDIKPLVDERLTPPLESKRGLAKWLQPHLNMPMNDINKLSYEDLRQLAMDAQKNANVYETALKVAKEKGHDLAPLLDGTASTFKESVDKMRLGGIAGAIDPPKNVKMALSDKGTPISPVSAKGSVLPDVQIPSSPTMAAADDVLGISAGGKQKKFTDPTDTRTYIVSKTEKDPFDFSKLADDFYTKNIDSQHALNKFDKYVETQTGKKLTAEERSHYLALNAKGADMTSNHILTERLVDPQGRVIGESLKDITSQIPSNPVSYKSFTDYLIARHAPTRMLRGEKVYNAQTKMTPESARAKVAEYEATYPEFKQIAEQLDEWNAKLGQSWLVDTGIVPQQVFDSWRTENPFWIPNQRKFTDLEKRVQTTGAKKGFGNQSNPVKKYNKHGSERPIVDPIESLIEYTDRYVKTARRNEVMQSVYKNILKSPEDFEGFATIVKREPIGSKALDGEGMGNLIDLLDGEFQSIMGSKMDKTKLDKDNIVSVLIDGERVHLKVEDPDFLDALLHLNPQSSNAVIEVARKATNAMKLLTTGINPIFGLTRNIFRDIPEGYVFSKTTDNPFRYAWDTLESFASVFADGALGGINNSRALQRLTPEYFKSFLVDRARLYKDYKALGGGHSSPAAANRDLLAQSKRSLLPQQNKGANIGKKAWNALENLNNALESGPRMGEFKRIRKAEGDDYSSRIRGLFEAQDLTTNFKRSGKIVKDLDAIFPYMNAAVQGLDKLLRSVKDRPAAVTGKALSMISLPTIALYAYNYNNPAYQKLSNHTKDNFYLIPTTDGKFIKIAKPRELSVPFSGLLERTMRAWFEEDPDAFKDFANTAATMFTPPGIPIQELAEGKYEEAALKPVKDTIAGPLVELAMNKNFADSPIVPKYLEGVSPRHQYDANTSELSKYIGDTMNVSPKQIDHLIRGYTGVIGQVALPATTQGATLGETLEKQMTADSVFSTDASKRFYELKDKLDMQYNDAKLTGEAPKGYSDDARKIMSQVASQMSDYTKAIREVDKSDMDRETKKDYKRQLTEQRNDLARQAYEAVRDALSK